MAINPAPVVPGRAPGQAAVQAPAADAVPAAAPAPVGPAASPAAASPAPAAIPAPAPSAAPAPAPGPAGVQKPAASKPLPPLPPLPARAAADQKDRNDKSEEQKNREDRLENKPMYHLLQMCNAYPNKRKKFHKHLQILRTLDPHFDIGPHLKVVIGLRGAIEMASVKAVEAILKTGVDPNALLPKVGSYPVHYAIQQMRNNLGHLVISYHLKGQEELIKIVNCLIKYGADLRKKNPGETSSMLSDIAASIRKKDWNFEGLESAKRAEMERNWIMLRDTLLAGHQSDLKALRVERKGFVEDAWIRNAGAYVPYGFPPGLPAPALPVEAPAFATLAPVERGVRDADIVKFDGHQSDLEGMSPGISGEALVDYYKDVFMKDPEHLAKIQSVLKAMFNAAMKKDPSPADIKGIIDLVQADIQCFDQVPGTDAYAEFISKKDKLLIIPLFTVVGGEKHMMTYLFYKDESKGGCTYYCCRINSGATADRRDKFSSGGISFYRIKDTKTFLDYWMPIFFNSMSIPIGDEGLLPSFHGGCCEQVCHMDEGFQRSGTCAWRSTIEGFLAILVMNIHRVFKEHSPHLSIIDSFKQARKFAEPWFLLFVACGKKLAVEKCGPYYPKVLPGMFFSKLEFCALEAEWNAAVRCKSYQAKESAAAPPAAGGPRPDSDVKVQGDAAQQGNTTPLSKEVWYDRERFRWLLEKELPALEPKLPKTMAPALAQLKTLVNDYFTGRLNRDAIESLAKRLEDSKPDTTINNAPLIWFLGLCYQRVIGGVSKDEARAVKFYQSAVDQGFIIAKVNMGHAKRFGFGGIKVDEKEAFDLYHQAFNEGDLRAGAFLADCYKEGQGVSKDPKRAVEYYRTLAEAGLATSQTSLGECYEKGIDVDAPDPIMARRYYKRAADQGFYLGQYRLAESLFESAKRKSIDPYVVSDLYYKAALQGNTDANYKMGICFWEGVGTIQNYDYAIDCFIIAAKEGHRAASARLAMIAAQENVKAQQALAAMQPPGAAIQPPAQAQVVPKANGGNGAAGNKPAGNNPNGNGGANGVAGAVAGPGGAPPVLMQYGKVPAGVERKGASDVVDKGPVAGQASDAAPAKPSIVKYDKFHWRNRYRLDWLLKNELSKLKAAYPTMAAAFVELENFVTDYLAYRLTPEALKAAVNAIEKANPNLTANNAPLIWLLGYCYRTGIGVNKREPEKAMRLFELAATRNFGPALTSLGVCCKNGDGTPVDKKRAFELFNQAFALGHELAQFYLGECYMRADGVEKPDTGKAMSYYWALAYKGHALSQYEIGECFFFGRDIGNEKNPLVAAKEYLEGAASHGDPVAFYLLAKCYCMLGEQPLLIFKNYQNAAEHGHSSAVYELGLCHRDGIGTPQNAEAALECFVEAGKLGHREAGEEARRMMGIRDPRV